MPIPQGLRETTKGRKYRLVPVSSDWKHLVYILAGLVSYGCIKLAGFFGLGLWSIPFALLLAAPVIGFAVFFVRSTKRGVTLWFPFTLPIVFVPPQKWDSTRSPYFKAFLNHEPVHVDQWVDLGRWEFVKRYLTREGRLRLEAPAFAASMFVWFSEHHRPYGMFEGLIVHEHPWAWYTKSLSRGYYLRGISTERIKDLLAEEYENRYGTHPGRYQWNNDVQQWRVLPLRFVNSGPPPNAGISR